MSKSAAYLAAVVSAILMGALGFFVRESASSAGVCSFARFFIGFVLIAIVWGIRLSRGIERLEFSAAAVSSGVCISLCILFYFLAIQYISVGVAALLLYIGPVLAAIGAAVVEHRLPQLRDVILLLLAAVGVGLVSYFSPSESTVSESSQVGFLYGLLAGGCYAGYIVLNRIIPQHVTLVARTFWQFAAGVTVLFLPLLGQDSPYNDIVIGWPYLLSIGVLQGFVVLLLVAYAVRRLTAIEFGTVSYLEPAVAVVLGFCIYGEMMSAGQWVGFALIILTSVAKSLLNSQS